MSRVVTGISQDGNITALRAALAAAGLALDPIQVIGPDDSTEGLARGIAGMGLITGGGGTGVPGMGGGSGMRFFRNESLADRLGDLEIPDSEVENYLEALHAGRSVVAYFAKSDTIDTVEHVFRDAKLANVRRF